MNPYKIIKKHEAILLRIANIVAWLKLLFIGKKYKQHIIGNKEFKDKEKGKSCFIVMGGLSVKDINLDFVSRYDAITANHFFQTEDYLKIKPKYHVIVDRDFWTQKKNIEDLEEKIKDFTTVFLNIRGSKIHDQENYRYILPIYRVVNEFVSMDISKACANFSTVTLTCIQLAVYLGYKTINLVGFDFPPGHFPHYYKESEDEKRGEILQKQMVDEYDYCSLYWQYTNSQHEAYKLSIFAKNNNIKIFNLSPISYVRAFTYKNFYES